ncbi:MAG: hypothetical protein ACO1QB_15595, partial [Verrucomicrobiales bacterium]
GKDADFVLWSGSPLDSRALCLETWIEGKQYFDRTQLVARTKALEDERENLLQKARKVAVLTKPEEKSPKAEAAFFQLPLELRYEAVDRHCEDLH